jgi:ABC-type branched-subunit amino acid transport system substrate-binding protein
MAAALTAVALVAAACSSGNSSSSTTTPAFKGSPVVIGQIVPLTGAALVLPQAGEAMTAAINYYNSMGGLQGHKLVLDQCDSQDSATVEAQCAQKLVNDHAVADIGGDTNFNVAAAQATLSAAGIPRIGMVVGSTTEYATKTDYAVDPGIILALAGLLVDLVRHGCTTPSLVTVQGPTSAELPALVGPIVTEAGGTLKNLVLVPGTATDYSTYVTATTANGSCGGAIALGTSQANAFIQAYKSVGATFKQSFTSGTYSSADLKKLPASVMTSAYYTFGVPFPDDPKVTGMSNVQKVLSGGGSKLTLATTEGQAVIPVLAMHAFMVAAGTIKGDITSASVNTAMASATDIPMWGVVPNWSPGKFITVGGPFGAIFTNVSNPLLWDEGWNGSHGTNNGTYNILAEIPGSGVSASST